MNKENNDFDPYNGILLGHKNEVLICATTWMNLENTVFEKPVTKDHILYDSIFMKC